MSEKETETKPEEKTEEKVDEKWSQEKQRADQAEANFKKASTEKDDLMLAISERDEKLGKLEQRIADLAESQDVPIEDLLDPDLVDAKTIKTVGKMAKEIRDQKKAIDKLTKLAEGFKEKAAKDDAKSEKDKTIERILKPLDKEFGAKFRNSARKRADKLVDDGTEKQPKDVIEAMTLMRACYMFVKDEAEKKETKTKTQTDSGTSSLSLDSPEVKKGSRLEVLADIKKKGLSLFGSKSGN